MAITKATLDRLAEIRAKRAAAAAPPAPAAPSPARNVSTAGTGVAALLRASQGGAPAAPPKPAAAPAKPAPKLLPSTTSTGLARRPALGEELGTSGKRFLPAGVSLSAFAAKVGKTVLQLEDYAEQRLTDQQGPAWIHTELPAWTAARRLRFAWDAGRRVWKDAASAPP